MGSNTKLGEGGLHKICGASLDPPYHPHCPGGPHQPDRGLVTGEMAIPYYTGRASDWVAREDELAAIWPMVLLGLSRYFGEGDVLVGEQHGGLPDAHTHTHTHALLVPFPPQRRHRAGLRHRLRGDAEPRARPPAAPPLRCRPPRGHRRAAGRGGR